MLRLLRSHLCFQREASWYLALCSLRCAPDPPSASAPLTAPTPWYLPLPAQVLLDTEGIDAYDQTAQYSTQIFSLAVLLSCLFVYNHMGGIDESALDRLSLVTEMTRHIRWGRTDHSTSALDPCVNPAARLHVPRLQPS